MMAFLIALIVVVWVIQIFTTCVTLSEDSHEEFNKDKEIQTKKQFLSRIIPFGFVASIYYWYKDLD